MRQKYIPAFIMLIAGAITSIINIYKKVELLESLQRLLLVLVLFFIIGLIARVIIRKATEPKPKTEEENEEEEQLSADNKSDTSEVKK